LLTRRSQRRRAMKKKGKGTKRAKKRGRPSDLSVDVKGGATDVFAKIGNIKGESFSVDIGTSERLKW
jgi:hypothetical protein